MLNKKLMLISFFLFCYGLIGLQAQKAIVTSGGNASGSGGTSSYTVGQVFYHTLAGTNGSVSQGVQQPFEISVVTGIEEAMAIQLMISAYPNPTVDFLILKVENYDREKSLYQLYDINGKVLINKSIQANETSIPVYEFVPGTYFLKVTDNYTVVKTFKIIKN